MIRPYRYQQRCIKVIVSAHRSKRKSALFVMAPGLGKTVTSVFALRQLFTRFGKGRVLFLCHQNDILEQAQLEYERVLGTQCTYGFFFGSNRDGAHGADIVFASFQTMREWKDNFRKREFKYIVVDESHHTHAITYRPTLEYFQPEFRIGMTATPDRMDLDIREIYGQEVFSLPLEDAFAQGLLTPVEYRLVTDEILNLGVLDTPIGKLSVRHLNRVLFIPKRDAEIARILLRHAKRIKSPRIMIFCQSTKHCDRLAKRLPGSLAVHHKLSRAEQRLRLRTFRQKVGGHIVLTVDMFNEGIDVPEANMIVFLRSTASHTVFFQQLGRGLRRLRGKEKVLVFDFVANCERLVMLERFHARVQKAREAVRTYEKKELVSIHYGKIHFSEVAKRVLHVIQAIRGGYTRLMLVRQLQALGRKLGRTPETGDVRKSSRAGACANEKTFHRLFGSFNAALQEAGFRSNFPRGHHTRKQMIAQLQVLGRKLGRTPRAVDVREACRRRQCASITRFRYVFGSHNKALKLAGLPFNQKKPSRERLV